MTTQIQSATPKPTQSEESTLNDRFETAEPAEILSWASNAFGRDVALVSSLGLEDMALFDMFWRINPEARLITLDTLRLPGDTYDLMDRVKSRYGVDIEAFYPDMESVAKMVREKGVNLFYHGVENRKLCCHIRKVDPLNRALSGVSAWITGLRRSQSSGRSGIKTVEWEAARGTWKISPIANWSFDQVRNYISENDVPYNELHDKGYPSIGCAPCTRAVKPGEDIRAGRWWWEIKDDAKECGLHVNQSS